MNDSESNIVHYVTYPRFRTEEYALSWRTEYLDFRLRHKSRPNDVTNRRRADLRAKHPAGSLPRNLAAKVACSGEWHGTAFRTYCGRRRLAARAPPRRRQWTRWRTAQLPAARANRAVSQPMPAIFHTPPGRSSRCVATTDPTVFALAEDTVEASRRLPVETRENKKRKVFQRLEHKNRLIVPIVRSVNQSWLLPFDMECRTQVPRTARKKRPVTKAIPDMLCFIHEKYYQVIKSYLSCLNII